MNHGRNSRLARPTISRPWSARTTPASTASTAAAATALTSRPCARPGTAASGSSHSRYRSTVYAVKVRLFIALEVTATLDFVEIVAALDGDSAGVRCWLTLDRHMIPRRASSASLNLRSDTRLRQA